MTQYFNALTFPHHSRNFVRINVYGDWSTFRKTLKKYDFFVKLFTVLTEDTSRMAVQKLKKIFHTVNFILKLRFYNSKWPKH